MDSEHKLGIETVNLHTNVSSSKLSDPKIWPRFSRLMATSEYMASSLALLFKVFGFKHCLFFYTDFGLSHEILEYFQEHAKRNGIDVKSLNFGSYMKAEDLVANTDEQLDNILESKYRIIVWTDLSSVLLNQGVYALWKKGYKHGDFINFEINP
jgi:hypothetical protein